MTKSFQLRLEAYPLLALAFLALTLPVRAQSATGTAPALGEDHPLEYAWGLGLGAGVVQPDTQSETYWSVNLRRRLGPRGERDGGSAAPGSAGLRAHVEGEFGYWKGETAVSKDKDILVGVNMIAAVPTPIVDLYLGIGFGVHFVDAQFVANNVMFDESDTRFGGNAQFGVELKVSQRVGIFGNGRLDFLSGSVRDRQYNKIWGGLRFYF